MTITKAGGAITKKIYGVLMVIAMTVNVIACGPKESNISSNSEDVVANEDIDNVPDVTTSDEVPTGAEESESTGIVVIDDYSDLNFMILKTKIMLTPEILRLVPE